MSFVKLVPDNDYIFPLEDALRLFDTGYDDILDDLTSALNGNEKKYLYF